MNNCNSEVTRNGIGQRNQPPASLVVRLTDLLKKARTEGCLPNNLVLDYGCGRGRNITPLLKAGFHVYAAEISSASHFSELKCNFGKNNNVTLIPLGNKPLEDMRNLKVKFAGVAALASIHHDPNPKEAVGLLQSITLPGGFHAVFVFTVASQPDWIKLGEQSSRDKPYQLTVLSPFGPNELLAYYQQKEWQVLHYEEGVKKDDTRNKIGPDKCESEHSHSFARILAKKIR